MNDAQEAQLTYARYIIGFYRAMYTGDLALAGWMHQEACLAYVGWALENSKRLDQNERFVSTIFDIRLKATVDRLVVKGEIKI